MSRFLGHTHKFASTMLIIFLTTTMIMLTSATPAAAARPGSSLFRLASREEMVHLAGYGEEKLSTVIVSGTVLCQAHPLPASPVPGASIGVKCHSGEMRGKSRWTHGTTDKYGDFTLDLPSHLHAIPDLHRVCTVKILRVPKNSPCRTAYAGKHRGMKLSSDGNGVRSYSAGTIKFPSFAPRRPKKLSTTRERSLLG